MFRKLVLPLAATALLAGCVTSAPYGYAGDRGDYYYGNPSVEYRYHEMGPGYGYPYGPGFSIYGGYGYGNYGYGDPYSYYGNPYYGGPYYGNPYYGYPYSGYPNRPTHRRPNPDTDDDSNNSGGAWRNLDEIVRRRQRGNDPGPGPGAGPGGSVPIVTAPTMQPRMRRDDDAGPQMREEVRRPEGLRPPSSQDQ